MKNLNFMGCLMLVLEGFHTIKFFCACSKFFRTSQCVNKQNNTDVVNAWVSSLDSNKKIWLLSSQTKLIMRKNWLDWILDKERMVTSET